MLRSKLRDGEDLPEGIPLFGIPEHLFCVFPVETLYRSGVDGGLGIRITEADTVTDEGGIRDRSGHCYLLNL